MLKTRRLIVVAMVVLGFLVVLGIFSCNQKGTKEYIPLINPAATEKTVNLFHFIQDIEGKLTLSGQHNFVGK